MKLYRGIKSNTFSLRTQKEEHSFKSRWRHILEERERGNFAYLEHLDVAITELHKGNRFSHQNFTDRREIAERYAKNEQGILIEIDVPMADILEYFDLEFQNYPKRRECFEIVYSISGNTLTDKQYDWKLNLTSFQ